MADNGVASYVARGENPHGKEFCSGRFDVQRYFDHRVDCYFRQQQYEKSNPDQPGTKDASKNDKRYGKLMKYKCMYMCTENTSYFLITSYHDTYIYT